MKKVIFCDIDGTLTKTKKKISKLNLIAIKKYLDNGGEFVLCTGRSYYACVEIIAKIEKFTNHKLKYLICLAGSCIVNLLTMDFSFFPIESQTIKNLYELANHQHLWFWGYCVKKDVKRVYSNTTLFSIFTHCSSNLRTYKIKKNIENLSFCKILIICALPKRLTYFVKKISFEDKDNLHIVIQNNFLLEITAHGINKGIAIRKVLALLNLNTIDAVSIGNGSNDIASFNTTGMSICVNCKKITVYSHATHHILHFKNAIYKAITNFII